VIETLGRRFARFVTNVVVRWPKTWRLFRRVMRLQFDKLAPVWDRGRDPTAFAALEQGLTAIDGEITSALDVGTGTGEAAFAIARRWPNARIVGIDVSPQMIEAARRKTPSGATVEFRVADAARIDEPDGTFDLVAAANMIPFFDELARLIAPRGYVVVSFSVGAETPIFVPSQRLRSEFARRGFADFAEFAVGRSTAFLARKR
jgi:ubiquinone/menaquinone biosynthesis C-methylase UbiE